MASGTQTFGLDETFIEPRVLPPPPTRHALFVFLILLASIVHIGTAGWSDIHNGAEGYYASVAREMFRTGNWAPPSANGVGVSHEPPLVYWAIVASFNVWGVSEAAARFPIAAATIAGVALTFLLGEQLAGYWRGFVAGLMHLCCLGTFIWGRIVTSSPVFAALLAAAVLCAVYGYQRQRTRRLSFAGVWLLAALACLAAGIAGLLLPAAILAASAMFYREARMRFRLLLDWRYLLLFFAILTPWHAWVHFQGSGADAQTSWSGWISPIAGSVAAGAEGMALGRFALVHLAWWFPLLLLVVPAMLLAPRRIFRPHEFDFRDALPLIWMALGFLPLLLYRNRQDYASLPMWPAVALASAWTWDRAPRGLRLCGIALTLLAGMAIALFAALGSAALPVLPPSPWPSARTVTALIGLALIVSCCIAAYFAWRHREDFAISAIMLGMVPIGLGTAEAMARYGAQFSLAESARFIQPHLGDDGEVLYEGSQHDGSSLAFYLDRQPFIISLASGGPKSAQHVDLAAALDKMSVVHPVYLIFGKERVPFWQAHLTERFHLYHQVTTCGPHVVVNNQP